MLCKTCSQATVLLQAGKLHFGVILGWSVVGSIGIWFVVTNLAGDSTPLQISSCLSLLKGHNGQTTTPE